MLSLKKDCHASLAMTIGYRFENCGARRAFLRPGFFRSLIRGSRERNPAFFICSRNFGSFFTNTRAIPSRIESACAVFPPPEVLISKSKSFFSPKSSRGDQSVRSTSRLSFHSCGSRSLIFISPFPPGNIFTVAREVFRFPIA